MCLGNEASIKHPQVRRFLTLWFGQQLRCWRVGSPEGRELYKSQSSKQPHPRLCLSSAWLFPNCVF